MREILLDKVTLNMGVGASTERLENAKTLLQRITGKKPVQTLARTRNPTFKIRKGEPIGMKVTLRGKQAEEILGKALQSRESKVLERSFDKGGTFSVGVKEYIDFPGMKYDPKIGMMGFDVCVTFKRRGIRIARRKIGTARLPKKQRVTREEAKEFILKTFKVQMVNEQ